MIPTRRLIWLLLGLFCLTILLAVYPVFQPNWLLFSGIVAGIVMFDALTVSSKRPLQVERKLMHALSLGTWSKVELILHNHYRYPISLQVFDHHSEGLQQQGLPLKVAILFLPTVGPGCNTTSSHWSAVRRIFERYNCAWIRRLASGKKIFFNPCIRKSGSIRIFPVS